MKLVALVLVVAALVSCGTDHGGGEGDTRAKDKTVPESSITIDPDVFTYQEDLGYSKETFVVTEAADDAAVVAAVERAGDRFLRVDEEGVEHTDATMDQAYAAGLYTPNYVSDPEVTDAGVEMYLDCKGSIEDPMAETLRKVLREELEASGVRAHVRALTFDE